MFQNVIWCVSITLSPFLNLSLCFLTVRLTDIWPHSSTTLAYKSITLTTFIGSTHATFSKAGHTPTCAYRLLSFPVCPLGSQNTAISHCFLACPNGALHCHLHYALTLTRIRHWCRCVDLHHHFSSLAKHCLAVQFYLSTTQANRRVSTSSICTTPTTRGTTTPLQVTCRCDYEPHEVSVIASLAYVIIMFQRLQISSAGYNN